MSAITSITTSSQQEWDLPKNLIVSIFSKLGGKTIAKCSSVSSTWHSASKNPQLRRKLLIDKAWHSPEGPEPSIINLECQTITTSTTQNHLVAVGGNHWLKIWDLRGGEWAVSCQDVPYGEHPCLAFTEGGLLVRGVTTNDGFQISGWEVDNAFRSLAFRRNHRGGPRSILGVGEAMIASGGDDGKVTLWEIPRFDFPGVAGESDCLLCEAMLEGHVGPVLCLATTCEERYLASGGSDGNIMIWNVRTKTRENLIPGHDSPVLSLTFDSGLLAGGFSNEVCVWRFREHSFECVWSCRDHKGAACTLWMDQNRVVCGGKEGEVCVWEVEGGGCVRRAKFSGEKVNMVWCSVKKLVVVGRGWIRVWDFGL